MMTEEENPDNTEQGTQSIHKKFSRKTKKLETLSVFVSVCLSPDFNVLYISINHDHYFWISTLCIRQILFNLVKIYDKFFKIYFINKECYFYNPICSAISILNF